MIYCEDCSSYDCGCPERKEIESLRQQLAAANTLINKYREETTSLRQQLADNDLFELDRNKWRNNYRRELAKLTEQVTLLRSSLLASANYIDTLGGTSLEVRRTLAATELKP